MSNALISSRLKELCLRNCASLCSRLDTIRPLLDATEQFQKLDMCVQKAGLVDSTPSLDDAFLENNRQVTLALTARNVMGRAMLRSRKSPKEELEAAMFGFSAATSAVQVAENVFISALLRRHVLLALLPYVEQ